jgi:hypothetical protein
MKTSNSTTPPPANAFINEPGPPTDAKLAAALGAAKAAWDQLLTCLAQELDVKDQEWKRHSPKWGWSLRVKRKARTVVWLSPRTGCFEVLFILGGKAMQAARQSRLPQRVTRVSDEAPKYPEGTGVRLEVKSARDLSTLMKLAEIKVAH